MAKNKNIQSFLKASRERNVRVASRAIKKALDEKVRARLSEKEQEIAKTLFRETHLNEDVLDKLQSNLKLKREKPVRFADGSTLNVDLATANALVTTFNALKQKPAQEKFRRMININSIEFMKLVDFAWSKSKG